MIIPLFLALPLTCQACGSQAVVRSRCFSKLETLAKFLLLSPVRCQACSHRFLAFRVGRGCPMPVMDRREHQRIPVHLTLSFSGGKTKGKGVVTNISRGGCRIETDTIVKVNEIYYLQLYIRDQESPVDVAAIVRSVRSRGIGVQFLRAGREN